MSVNILRSSVLEDGTLPFPTRGPKSIQIPVEEEKTYAANALKGLNLLQTRYDAAIDSKSLTSALEYLYDHLPAKVSNLMTWQSPDDFDIFPYGIDHADTVGYERYLKQFGSQFESSYESIRKREYYIQQVDTKDDHYVTVILHLRKDDPKKKNAPFTAVDYSVFIDPDTGFAADARLKKVRARIAAFLRPGLANIDDFAAHEGELWVPPSRDEDAFFSSGLRAFVLFEQFTRRLVDLYCEGKTYDADALWRPTCAWTNLEKARDDMIGAASRQVRRYMGFTPRVTLSLLKGPKNGKEEPHAPVRHRLFTPPEIGLIGTFRFDDESASSSSRTDQDLVTAHSDSEKEYTASVSSDEEDVDSGNPPPPVRKGLLKRGLPRIGSDDSDDKEDLQQNVDDAFIQLIGGDDADEMADEEEEVEQPTKPTPSTDVLPTDDVELADVGSDDDEEAEGAEVTMQDENTAAADHESDDEQQQQQAAAEQNGNDGTPLFYGPKWPEEVPLPTSAVRYLADRLDLQKPEPDVFIIDVDEDEPLPTVEGNTVGNDYFDIEVESPAAIREQLPTPAEDIKIIFTDHQGRVNTAESQAPPEMYDSSPPLSPNEVEEGEKENAFSRSDAPSPAPQPQPEAPMESLSTLPSQQSLNVEGPATPSPSPQSRPSSPPVEVEKSAKRKFSLVSDYDDDDDDTAPEEPPAKRQHNEEPVPDATTAGEYGPELPPIGAPAWGWPAVNTTGSHIPGLTLAQESTTPAETSTLPETQATEDGGDGQVGDTDQSTSGVPAYIA
ncbi:hypothetical protein PG994_004444 [Apiospora phragmitis]|uniref:Uncharacterized protein n=1 Tax=Apiospora phragmitis TaxID=2905665 RepID=A0ABR1VQL5_9PEZI